uniref:Uncharacterized protein n=1 Tax=Timema poppense TaxID=170557 RepID=A0A7R9CZE7_TIMPO|nr:unnamed protein product [Timema poppensis]
MKLDIQNKHSHWGSVSSSILIQVDLEQDFHKASENRVCSTILIFKFLFISIKYQLIQDVTDGIVMIYVTKIMIKTRRTVESRIIRQSVETAVIEDLLVQEGSCIASLSRICQVEKPF